MSVKPFQCTFKIGNTEIKKREKERGNFFGNSLKVSSNLNGWCNLHLRLFSGRNRVSNFIPVCKPAYSESQ
jgi:hypothetical protein